MEKSAIVQIQESANIPTLVEQLSKAGFPVAALPESYNIHDLEIYSPYRNQFRGVMSTSHIVEFVRYHKEQLQDHSQCFVDADDMSAVTIFDLGDEEHPGHCRNKARVSLRKTASFAKLLHINELKLSQKALAEFVEDYSEFLRVFSVLGEVIEASVASAAIRNMKFEARQGRESNVDDFAARQSEYAAVEVRTKDEFPMPAVFQFTCVPYLGLMERVFEMRMSTIGNETLVLRIKKLEQHEEEMGEEFQNKLGQEFQRAGIDIDTFIGSFTS